MLNEWVFLTCWIRNTTTNMFPLKKSFFFLSAGGPEASTTKKRTGANLFQDFQVLGRIWTHPWCLKLSDLSKENKVEQNFTALTFSSSVWPNMLIKISVYFYFVTETFGWEESSWGSSSADECRDDCGWEVTYYPYLYFPFSEKTNNTLCRVHTARQFMAQCRPWLRR